MALYYGFDALHELHPTVVTVGSFDGVHAGHHRLLGQLKAMAERLSARSVVVTFEPHPRIAMHRDEGLKLLTTVEERTLLLERYGIDCVVVAHFDEEFRRQSYAAFVRDCLVGRLGMVGMVVGYNHRFGKGSEGSYDSLVPLAREYGFEVERVEQYTDTGDKVSSTVVRRLIEQGDVERARQMLAHPYIIIGMAHEGVLIVEDSYKLLVGEGEYPAVVNGRATRVEIVGRTIRFSDDVKGSVVVEL